MFYTMNFSRNHPPARTLAPAAPAAGPAPRRLDRPSLRSPRALLPMLALMPALAPAALSGCSAIRRDAAAIDRDYHSRVAQFAVNLGPAGLTTTWVYRAPGTPAAPVLPIPSPK